MIFYTFHPPGCGWFIRMNPGNSPVILSPGTFWNILEY